jgi:YHS domain-containing protein
MQAFVKSISISRMELQSRDMIRSPIFFKIGPLKEAGNGVAYYFTSEADLAEFRKNPEIYEPQYGGWCAYAMGKDGTKVEVDPETFKIVNGKLFLFYNQFFTNTLKSWNKDEVELHHHADLNWTKIFH